MCQCRAEQEFSTKFEANQSTREKYSQGHAYAMRFTDDGLKNLRHRYHLMGKSLPEFVDSWLRRTGLDEHGQALWRRSISS